MQIADVKKRFPEIVNKLTRENRHIRKIVVQRAVAHYIVTRGKMK